MDEDIELEACESSRKILHLRVVDLEADVQRLRALLREFVTTVEMMVEDMGYECPAYVDDCLVRARQEVGDG